MEILVMGETTLMPVVDASGTYTLLVTNTSNGCTSTAEVFVNENTDLPDASATAPVELTCTQTVVSLDGTGSSSGANFTYEWSTLNGNIVSGGTTLSPDVDAAGDYEILVTDQTNGCTATASVEVILNGELPTSEAGMANDLTCNDPEITLDGNGSSQGTEFIYQWSTADGNIVSGANSLTPTVDAMGTYELLVTNQTNGCSSISTVFVNENNTPPTLAVALVTPISCDFPEITIDGSGSSTGAEFSYQWSTVDGNIVSGETTLMPVVNLLGTYNLLITNIISGCTTEEDVDVLGDTDQPISDAGVSDPITCTQTTVTLNGNGSSAGAEFTYEWTTSNGNIVSGETTLTPDVDAGGIYQLVVTDMTNNCTAVSSVEVEVDGDIPTADAGAEGLLNCNITNTLLDGSGSTTGVDISYLWTTLDGNIVSGETTLTPEIDEPGTYELLVSDDGNGCTATSSVVVLLDNAPPTSDAGIAQTLSCTVNSLQLDGGGSSQGADYTYLWTTVNGNILSGETTLTPEVNATGTYELEVTFLNNGCTATSSVEVQQDASLPVADAGPSFEITCSVLWGNLDGTGSVITPDISYEWTTLNGNIVSGASTLTPEIDAPGTYQLTLTNTMNGCTAISTVTIPENNTPPAADAGAPMELNCYNGILNLDGTNSETGVDLTYLWTTADGNIISGETTLTPEIDALGMYELLITNTQTGCTSIAQVNVSEDFQDPVVDAGPSFELNCTEVVTTLNGGGSSTGSNFTYEWTTLDGNILSGENTLNPEVDEPGMYELLVTNTDNGCTALENVIITQDIQQPTAEAGTAAELTCATTTLTLDGSNSSTGTNFQYEWTTLDGNILSGNSSINPVIDQPGTYILEVTNTSNNCTATSEIIVNQDITAPIADAGVEATLTCAITQTQLDGSNSSLGNSYSYLWTTIDGNIISGETTLFPAVDATGSYELFVTNTTNGCTSTSSVNVILDGDVPDAIASPESMLTCSETIVNLLGSGSSIGNEFMYGWTTLNGNIVSGGTTLFPTVNQPGDYTLLVTNTSNGCTNTTTIQVEEDVTSPTAVIDQTTNLMLNCATTSLVLDGSGSAPIGNLSFSWTTLNGNIVSGTNTPNPEVDDPGTYTLTVTNTINGCTASTSVTVTQDITVPNAGIANPDILTCDITEVTLDGTNSSMGPNYTYQWTTANGNILSGGTTLTPIVNQSGTYILTVLDQTTNCENQASIQVGENTTPPTAEAGNADLLDCLTESIQLNGNGSSGGNNITYDWSTSTGNIMTNPNAVMITVDAPGAYTLLVTDTGNGCTATDDVVVGIDPSSPTGIDISQEDPECAGEPGSVTVEAVNGGTPPYLYSVNGVDFYSGHTFTLEPGDYILIAQDAIGCETETSFTIPDLEEVTINISPNAMIEMGENHQIIVTTNIPVGEIALIEWSPSE